MSEHESKETETRKGVLYRTWMNYVVLLRIFLTYVERGFSRLGRQVGLYPKSTIVVCLAVIALCSLGLLRFKEEMRTDKLYVPKNSLAEQALEAGKPYFRNRLNTRYEEIIVKREDGSNMLSPHLLAETYSLIQDIETIKGYKALCTGIPTFLKRAPRFSNQPCRQINIFEILRKNFTHESVFNDFAEGLRSGKLMSNGRMLEHNIGEVLTQFKLNVTIKTVSAKALRVVFLMENQDTQEKNSEVLAWEKQFIDSMEEARSKSTSLQIEYTAERSMDDAISDSSSNDIGLISITFTIMITFACLCLAKFVNPIRGHNWLAISGVVTTALGILCGIGLSMAIGLPFISLVGIAPFLVVSIGIDDMFILVDEFDRESKDCEPKQRVTNTLAKVGATITMTTVTDVVAFFISATSSFPAIQYFCIYTAFCLTFNFLLQITLFVTLMTFDSIRISKNRCDILPCITVADRMCCNLKDGFSLSAKLLKKYAAILLTVPSKVFVVVLTLCLLVAGVFCSLHIDTKFTRQTLALPDSHFSRYITTYEDTFPQTIAVSIQNTESGLNYSDKNVRKNISKSVEMAHATGYYLKRYSSWIDSFDRFTKQENMSSDGTHFNTALKKFLDHPQYQYHNLDVVVDNVTGDIYASRIQVYYKHSLDSNFHKEAMLTLRKELTERKSDSKIVADAFVFFEQYAIVIEELLSNVIAVSVVILIVLIPFCVHPLIVFFLFAQFILLVLDLFALMYAWDIQLNSISMVCMVMSVGFSVDYSTHIAHAFVVSQEKSANERIVEALSTVGGSVLLGGVSTFLGMLLTGFASSPIFQIFFKMFVGIIIFGLYNGLVLLPVLLSLFSCLIDMKLPEWNKEKKNPLWGVKKKKNQDNSKKETRQKSISVLGFSTRFPTAKTKEEFWDLLQGGRNTVTDYPTNRHNVSQSFEENYRPQRSIPGKIYATKGSYLEDIEGFDYMFFGVTQSEAKVMDPQQRLLLQGTYEAVEDAGLTLNELQQCNTGVYVGSMIQDYRKVVTTTEALPYVDQFTATGNDRAILANRISFAFNLSGPSVCFDTACSSSVTALSMACDHLRQGVADIAIVASANIILSVKHQKIACAVNMLAPDGKCKVFQEAADGYGRGEAVIVFVLKASDLVNSTDIPYCDILGWGINNDGHTATPITAPSVEGQKRLIESTLQSAHVDPLEVQYLEMHGTGTIIGDSVELKSVDGTYGKYRTNQPLLVGSVKSNVNHTESAAGLAGLSKVCLMISRKQFVKTVGVDRPAIRLGIEQTNLKIQQENMHWPVNINKVPRMASINSFGFGGSNGHVVVREHIPPQEVCLPIDRTHTFQTNVLVLSGKSTKALYEQAERCSEWLTTMEDTRHNRSDVCYSLNERRSAHNVRMAVDASSLLEAARIMKDVCERPDDKQNGACVGKADKISSKVAFVFGGQGSQWMGMAGDVLQNTCLLEYVTEVHRHTASMFSQKYDVMAYLTTSDESNEHSLVTLQLAIFSMQYALAKYLMLHADVIPTAVSGHSLGDITAACIAGVIDLKTAIKIIATRAKLQEKSQSNGSMAAIGLSEGKTVDILQRLSLEKQLCIAAINDHKNVTISGDEVAIQTVGDYLNNNDTKVFFKKLATDKAFHSHHMNPLHQAFVKKVSGAHIKPKQTHTRYFSTTEGRLLNGVDDVDDHFWWKNLRGKVQFQQAISGMLSSGVNTLVEISPRPVVSYYIKQIALHMQLDNINVLQALPRMNENLRLQHFNVQCIGKLFTLGYPVNFTKLQAAVDAKFVRYPSYAWQETKLWGMKEGSPVTPTALSLGTPVSITANETSWRSEIDLHIFPYIRDHRHKSFGMVVPGAFYINQHLSACLLDSKVKRMNVNDITFQHLLQIDETSTKQVKCSKKWDGKGRVQVEIKQYNEHGEILLSTANFTTPQDDSKALSFQEAMSHTMNESNTDQINQQKTLNEIEILNLASLAPSNEYLSFQNVIDESSFDFGEKFRLIEKAWQNEGIVVAKIKTPDWLLAEAGDYVIHPCIIDACLQTRALIRRGDVIQGVPTGVKKISLLPLTETFDSLYCVSELDEEGCFQAKLIEDHGSIIMVINNLQLTNGVKREPTIHNSLYQFNYVSSTLKNDDRKRDETYIVIGKEGSKWAHDMPRALEMLQVAPSNIKTLLLNSKVVTDAFMTAFKQALGDAKEPIFIINLLPMESMNVSLKQDLSPNAEWLSFESTLNVLQMVTRNKKEKCNVIALTPALTPWSSLTHGLARVANLETAYSVTCVDINVVSSSLEVCRQALKAADVQWAKDGVVLGGEDQIYQPCLNRILIDDVSKSKGGSRKFNNNDFYLSWSEVRKVFVAKELHSDQLKADHVEIRVKYMSSISGSHFQLLSNATKFNACPIGQVVCGTVSLSTSSQFQCDETVVAFVKSKWIRSKVQVPTNCVFRIDDLEILPQNVAALSGCMIFAHEVLNRLQATNSDLSTVLCVSDSSYGNLVQAFKHLAESQGIQVRICSENACNSSLIELLAEYAESKFDCVVYSSGIHPLDCSMLTDCLKDNGILAVFDNEEKVTPVEYRFPREVTLMNFKPKLRASNESQTIDVFKQHCNTILKSMTRNVQVGCIRIDKIYQKNDALATKGKGFTCLTFDEVKSLTVDPPSMDYQGFKEDRTYIVIGGSKGLGLATVKWLASRGAGTVIATSRSQASTQREFASLEKRFGTKVVHVQADVSSKEGFRRLGVILDALPSVAGVINSAAAPNDQLYMEIDQPNYRKVMAPKVDGTLFLQQLLEKREERLDFFVLYSSITSVLGNTGQASYAAANAFMNGFAEYRQKKLGQRCLSVCWGAMKGGGMIEAGSALQTLLEKNGFWLLDIETGLKMLDKVLTARSDLSTVWICDIGWNEYFKGAASSRAKSVLFENLRSEIQVEETDSTEGLYARVLKAKSVEVQKALLLDYLVKWLAGWMNGSAEEIDCNVPFFTYGIDSVSASHLKFEIANKLHVDLEVFFFMQSKTTALTLAMTLVEAINKETKTKEENTDSTEQNDDDAEVQAGIRGRRSGVFRSSKRVVPMSCREEEIRLPRDFLSCLYSPAEAKAKMFIVHPAHRYAGVFQPMTLGMKYQELFSLYAFGSSDPTFISEEGGSVKKLAHAYLKLLYKEQPFGPYFLAGYSFGGTIAVEMASQLHGQGKEVAMLFMIDTLNWAPQAECNTQFVMKTLNQVSFAANIEEQVRALFARVACSSLRMNHSEFEDSTQSMTNDEISTFLDQKARQMELNIPDTAKILESIRRDHETGWKLHREWAPSVQLYKGNILYISAENCLCKSKCSCHNAIVSAYKSWRRVLNNLTRVRVPGNHFTMMDKGLAPNVGRVLSLTASLMYRTLHPNVSCLPMHSQHRSAVNTLSTAGLPVYTTHKPGTKSSARKVTVKINKDLTKLILFGSLTSSFIPIKEILCIQLADKRRLSETSIWSYYSGYVISMKKKNKRCAILCESRGDFNTFTYLMEAVYKVIFPPM